MIWLLDCGIIVTRAVHGMPITDAKIGQGRENAKTYLRENPLVCEEVEAKVREKFQLDGTAEETDAEGEPEVLEDEE